MKLRLLIAEDEANVTGSTRAALVMDGHHVEVATDAGEVLELAEQLRPSKLRVDHILFGTRSGGRRIRLCWARGSLVLAVSVIDSR